VREGFEAAPRPAQPGIPARSRAFGNGAVLRSAATRSRTSQLAVLFGSVSDQVRSRMEGFEELRATIPRLAKLAGVLPDGESYD